MRIPKEDINVFGIKTTDGRLLVIVLLLVLIGFTATNNWVELLLALIFGIILIGVRE